MRRAANRSSRSSSASSQSADPTLSARPRPDDPRTIPGRCRPLPLRPFDRRGRTIWTVWTMSMQGFARVPGRPAAAEALAGRHRTQARPATDQALWLRLLQWLASASCRRARYCRWRCATWLIAVPAHAQIARDSACWPAVEPQCHPLHCCRSRSLRRVRRPMRQATTLALWPIAPRCLDADCVVRFPGSGRQTAPRVLQPLPHVQGSSDSFVWFAAIGERRPSAADSCVRGPRHTVRPCQS